MGANRGIEEPGTKIMRVAAVLILMIIAMLAASASANTVTVARSETLLPIAQSRI